MELKIFLPTPWKVWKTFASQLTFLTMVLIRSVEQTRLSHIFPYLAFELFGLDRNICFMFYIWNWDTGFNVYRQQDKSILRLALYYVPSSLHKSRLYNPHKYKWQTTNVTSVLVSLNSEFSLTKMVFFIIWGLCGLWRLSGLCGCRNCIRRKTISLKTLK